MGPPPPEFYNSILSSQFDKRSAIQDKLTLLEDPQVELYSLRSCLSVCKVTHTLRCVPTSSLGLFPSCFDLRLQECLSRIMRCSIPGGAWSQATLPFRLGGLGLHESNRSANPAFLGSCNFTHILLSRLVGSSDVSMALPGEVCALSFFEHLPISVSEASSQNDIQASLDDLLFKQLLHCSNIRDQARLQAVSHPSGTCSGWLKAFPQPSLGLAFTTHDFIVALHLWLRIFPLFPLSPLCNLPLCY